MTDINPVRTRIVVRIVPKDLFTYLPSWSGGTNATRSLDASIFSK
jgi:hypothetical protein